MQHTILITGCTRGLGYALAECFAKKGFKVFAVGRNKKILDELVKKLPNIQSIVADITEPHSREIIFNAVKNEHFLSVIHNAGIVLPSLINSLTSDALYQHFETNFFAPILINQKLLPILKKDSRVLHISSGAADIALAGLMPYCTSKAALERTTHCFNQELNSQGIYFANLRPGMVDTDMQKHLRKSNESSLPNKSFYLTAKKENTLIPSQVAAEFITWVMDKTTSTEFSQTLWNIYNLEHRNHWFNEKIENWRFPR